MSDRRTICVNINGKAYEREVETRLHLADFIRHECLLTGTHVGCEHGVCGACTILLDGKTARSCLMLAVQADGKEILTVEGIAPNETECTRYSRHFKIIMDFNAAFAHRGC